MTNFLNKYILNKVKADYNFRRFLLFVGVKIPSLQIVPLVNEIVEDDYNHLIIIIINNNLTFIFQIKHNM